MEESKLRIGCSGWSYKDWSEIFYPRGLQAKDYLKFYSNVFNCVEIDSSFYSVLSKLGGKLGPIAVQLPPSVKVSTHLETMKKFLDQLSPDFRHAIEFRHKSWFTPEVYELLRSKRVAMVWSLNQYVETPPEVTADFVYLRLVGDREITEFTGIQRDRSEEMKRWASAIKSKSEKFEDGYVFFNNHFAGFSPESANEFRRLLGLMELDWRSGGSGQQTLLG